MLADYAPDDIGADDGSERMKAPATRTARILWVTGGIALIVLTFAVLAAEQMEVAGLGDDTPLYGTIALRCAEFGLLSAGAYGLVRGRWRG
ncbi:hypothetical protein ABZ208_01135 [Streptomyces sp. NPDC006208]|uniref:hypothetical protein n=1 Tax=Streptomyces sp. NPDC006208 TaxID=3156734 RepID=UPI0033B27A08